MASLAEYLSNDKWIISKLLLQTIEEFYLHSPSNLVKFDAPFIEIGWHRARGNWLEKAYLASKGEWIGVMLIEIDTFI